MPSPSPAFVTAMRRALLVGYAATAATLLAGVGLGALVAGAPGAWGAGLGVAVGAGFLSVTTVVALLTARLDATRLAVAVLGSWVVKLLLLVAVLAALQGATFYSRGAFFVGFAVSTMGYLLLEGWVLVRARTPYLEPSPPTDRP